MLNTILSILLKILAHSAIPLLTAWLGYHLATERLQDGKEKQTYRNRFFYLALAGLIVTTIVEISEFRSHKHDIEDLKTSFESSLNKTFQELANKLYPNLPPSEALEKLKKLETRTSTLEQKTAFRSLTQEQQTQLIKSLSPYQGHNIHIAEVWSDSEAMNFAEIIKGVFEKAGWKIHSTQGLYSSPPFGIILGVKDAHSQDGIVIFYAFQAIGLQVEAKLNNDPTSKDEVILIIGSKKQ